MQFRLLEIEFFFTDIQRCKNFFQHYTLQEIFFSVQHAFFPRYFLAKSFFLEISLESRRCPESGKVLLVEYGIQQSFALKGGIPGFGTRNTAQGIWNSLTIGIQDQSSTIKESEMQYIESGNHGVESRNQDCCP